MGWERKRGKILEFARLVAGSTNTSYTVDSQTEQDLVRRLHGLRYVVTLDAQSQLHPGGARQLISILAHPANQAVIDPGNGRVVAGFCFVRPLVVFREPTSLFAWATRPKRRPSEAPALQQHFGRDYFLGQGAIDIRTFLAVFDTAIPDSTVLSHDKLEGMHARAICDIDTLIVDDAPEDYLVARLRDHRWVRGDFQLVRWIFAGRGSRVRQLPALERYLLLDDLLHHVSPAATVTLLALGWLRLPAPAAGLFTAGVVLIPLLADHAIFEPLIRFGRYCRRYPGPGQPGPLPEDPSLHDSTSHVTRQITAELVSLPIWIILLPDRAVQNLDAALRALYRSFVSHQLTLQWTPSRAGSRSVGPTMMLRWRVMSASCVISAVLLACVWVVNPVALPSALPVLAVWLAAPVIVYQIGRAARRLPFTARPSAADGA